MTPTIAVTILSGSTGSIGTGFMDRMLAAVEGSKVTAIVPSGGGKKRKAAAIAGVDRVQTTQRFARYGQGCGCCTVRSDLIVKIKEIVVQDSADHILVQIPPNGDLNFVHLSSAQWKSLAAS